MTIKSANTRAWASIIVMAFLGGACASGKEASSALQSEEIRVYAVHKPERMDDFAWENDLVAFRAYGPAARSGAENNGIDAWYKYVTRPVIEQRYDDHLNNDQSYHKDWGNGYDIYHVGSSAGIGSEALWIDGQRVGMETWVEHRIVSMSRERVEFVLEYRLEHESHVYTQQKTVVLELGSQLFSVDSVFYKDGQLAVDLPIAVAVATHDGAAQSVISPDYGVISTWEVLQDGFGVGSAVIVPEDRIVAEALILDEGVKDSGHALYVLHTDSAGSVSYHAGFAWQRAGVITDFAQWRTYLNEYSMRLR